MTVHADRVQVVTTTTGTGALSLGIATEGHRTFGGALASGSEVTYLLQSGAAWEIGSGTFTTGPDTLTRTLSSSSTGALLDLAAGTHTVSLVVTAATIDETSNYDPSAVALTSLTKQEAIDELCTLPPQTKSADYTLLATDVGGVISISTGTITVPPSVFSAGDVVVIYNNSADSRSITRGEGVTMYWVSASNANRTLAARGVATILCVGANEFVITGQGLS